MPYETLWKPNGVLQCFAGEVTRAEFFTAVESLLGDARLDTASFLIKDLRALDRLTLDAADIEAYAAYRVGLYFSNPRIWSAFIVSNDEGRKLAEPMLLPNFRSAHPTEIFSDLDAAQAWLRQHCPVELPV